MVEIMGLLSDASLSLSQFLCHACKKGDVFLPDLEICQLEVNQRKVNMPAIKLANEASKKTALMILLHHVPMALQSAEKPRHG
jgi:hypothetical protein